MLNTSQNTKQAYSRSRICSPRLYPASWYVQEWSDPQEVSHMLFDIVKEKKANYMSNSRFLDEVAMRINHAELCHFKVTLSMLNTLLMGKITGQEQDSGLAALMYAVVCIVYDDKIAEDWNKKVG